MQQNGPAGEVCFAEPQRLGKVPPLLLGVGPLPAPLIFLPAGGEVSQAEAGDALVIVHLRVVRLEDERLLVLDDGVGGAVQRRQRDAEVVVGFDIVRPQGDRPLVPIDRLGGTVECLQDVAELVVRLGPIGRDHDGAADQRDRFVEFALLPAHDAQVAQGVDVVAVRREHRGVDRRSFLQPPLALQRHCLRHRLRQGRGARV